MESSRLQKPQAPQIECRQKERSAPEPMVMPSWPGGRASSESFAHQPFATRFLDRRTRPVRNCYPQSFAARRNRRGEAGGPAAYDKNIRLVGNWHDLDVDHASCEAECLRPECARRMHTLDHFGNGLDKAVQVTVLDDQRRGNFQHHEIVARTSASRKPLSRNSRITITCPNMPEWIFMNASKGTRKRSFSGAWNSDPVQKSDAPDFLNHFVTGKSRA